MACRAVEAGCTASITSHSRHSGQARRAPARCRACRATVPRGTVCAMADGPIRRTRRRVGVRLALRHRATGRRRLRPCGAGRTGRSRRRATRSPTQMLPTMNRVRRRGQPAGTAAPRSRPRAHGAGPAPAAGGPLARPTPQPPGAALGRGSLVLLLGGLPGRRTRLVAWTKVDKVDATPAGDRPGRPAGHDLPAGRQRQPRGADPQAGAAAAAPGKAEGQRTDTIMLLHTGSGPNLLMSIPRDSLVPIPGPRHEQDQRGLRLRRPEAAGQDDRAEHRHPHRRLRRDRVRRLRRTSSTPSAAIQICPNPER